MDHRVALARQGDTVLPRGLHQAVFNAGEVTQPQDPNGAWVGLKNVALGIKLNHPLVSAGHKQFVSGLQLVLGPFRFVVVPLNLPIQSGHFIGCGGEQIKAFCGRGEHQFSDQDRALTDRHMDPLDARSGRHAA